MRSGDGKMDRKTVEKNRRLKMKNLCFKLASLIPKHEFLAKDGSTSQLDHLDRAAAYIQKLRERIERLKQEKEIKEDGKDLGLKLPVVEVRHQDQSLEVLLISGLNRRFAFHQVVAVLEEGGAEVVNASFSTVGSKIFYTIHCQAAVSSQIGLEASRVSNRLQQLLR